MDQLNVATFGDNSDNLPQHSSSLSPYAVPFVPKFQASSPRGPNSGLESYNACSMLSPAARAFIPTLSAESPEFVPTSSATPSTESYLPPPVDVVSETRNFLWLLTRDPENLENLLPPLFSLCVENIKNQQVSKVIDEIFNQAVNEANFRYTGARLCAFLSENVPRSTGFDIQELLVCRCLQEQGDLLTMPSSENRLIGLTLFLGELLVNMKDMPGSAPVKQFPQEIVKLVHQLLGSRSENATRCVIQVLKLSGSVLEDKGVLDEVFKEVQARLADPSSLPSNLLGAMKSVVSLRQSNWGRSQNDAGSEAPVNQITVANSQYWEVKNRSFDESDLCDDFDRLSGFASNEGVDTSNGSCGEYWGGDQVMDSETAAAYEQFLLGMHESSSGSKTKPSNDKPAHHNNGFSSNRH